MEGLGWIEGTTEIDERPKNLDPFIAGGSSVKGFLACINGIRIESAHEFAAIPFQWDPGKSKWKYGYKAINKE